MPGPLTPAAFRKRLAAGNPDPIHLIEGEDEAEKTRLAGEVASLVDEGVRAFNVQRFYASDPSVTLGAVLDAARTVPLLGDRRIVMVLQAERLLEPRRESDAAIAECEEYLKSPSPHCCLVLIPSAPLDRRRRIVTSLYRHATVVDASGPGEGSELARWVKTRFETAGATVDAAALRLLVERAGTPARLQADVERLLLYTGPGARVTVADVEEVAGGSHARDPWALNRALERGDLASALRELALSLEEGNSPHMILGQLAHFVRSTLPAPRTAAAVQAVFRTDLDLKSSAGDPRILLERLVVELADDGRGGRRPGASRRR